MPADAPRSPSLSRPPIGRASAAACAIAALVALIACGDRARGNGIVASGHIEATDVRAATKVGGRLASFPLEEGDRVEAGQEIGRIDPVDLDLARDAAKAEAERADADLQLLLAGSRREDIAEAGALVDKAAAEADAARRDLDRLQALLDAGSGTEKSRDDARARLDAAHAALEAARQRHLRLEAGSRPEEVAAARARLASARAHVAQTEQQLRDAVIPCPAKGIVTETLADPGEIVAPGQVLAVITEIDDPWLNVYVGEPDLDRVRIGQPVEVRTDGGQVRRGAVTFIASDAEFTPRNVQTRDERTKLVFKVKVGLPNPDGLFKPGMPAEARFGVAAGGTP
jgi:HlyD family secretion protein